VLRLCQPCQLPRHTCMRPRGMTNNPSSGLVHWALPVRVSEVSRDFQETHYNSNSGCFSSSRRAPTILHQLLEERRKRQQVGPSCNDRTLDTQRTHFVSALLTSSYEDPFVRTTGSAIVTQKVILHFRAGSSHLAKASLTSIPSGNSEVREDE
jgi:hypothetical protein